ncbi:hypothetical protein [Streptomyces sirii]|uniref:hypothetical protein n=1 Tax=Streptomyces sirii TaxID=3127701 RepID=UPI003D3614AA
MDQRSGRTGGARRCTRLPLPRGPRALPPAPRAVVTLIAAAMLYGACVHLAGLVLWGFCSRTWAPLWLNGFWNSLIVFDSLSGALLLKGRRSGLYLTCLTMFADLVSNLYAVYAVRHSGLGAGAADVVVLLAFGLFVFALAPWLHGCLGRTLRTHRHPAIR